MAAERLDEADCRRPRGRISGWPGGVSLASGNAFPAGGAAVAWWAAQVHQLRLAQRAASGTTSAEPGAEYKSRSISYAAKQPLDRGGEEQEEQREVIDPREHDTDDKGERQQRGRGQRRPRGRVPGRDALAPQQRAPPHEGRDQG